MTDRFEEFMKRNVPETTGPLRALELPPKRNWLAGLALSGALAASLTVMTVNRSVEDIYTGDLIVSFEEDLPAEIQDSEMLFDEM